jgi:hypothetical protein
MCDFACFLAKQVLSQLIYTPTKLTFYSKILFGAGHLLSSLGTGNDHRTL